MPTVNSEGYRERRESRGSGRIGLRQAAQRLAVAVIVWSAALSERGMCEVPPNTLSEAEARTGWRLLFDGRTLDAFRGYRKESVGEGWAVEDGAIVRKAAGAGDLVTRDVFGAFELQIEYRISSGGNSGLMFHVTEEEKAPWMTGPEVQILDNAMGKDPQSAGWLYQLYQPSKPRWLVSAEKEAGRPDAAADRPIDATRPAGEWNHLYLRVAPDAGEVELNGVNYYRFQKGSKDWAERVAKSKFAAYPGFGKAEEGHICLQDHGDRVAFRSIKIREIPARGAEPSAGLPGEPVLPVRAVAAFPGVEWEGWSPETADGKPAPALRPLVVSHAGDGSGRKFVLDQAGMIHVLPAGGDGEAVARAKLFLDLRPATAPWGKANEEGLLGIAFHPRYRENGQFFVCYSVGGERRGQRVSRFRVSKDDPDRADPASEEVILFIEQPYSNHNGGSIVFGPGGHLCIGLGDGGLRNDPDSNGQNLGTWLGSILRIDVDRRGGIDGQDEARPYGIPADNPFRSTPGARPEIYAYGFRNPWQLSFDPPTGRLFAADVGQELWEEIDLVIAGGNYGWSLKEGSKPFGPVASHVATIDPVFEYDHRIGKSITGGFVYRGGAVPVLEGRYLYGDFVSGRLWAVTIEDSDTGPARAVANAAIPWNGLPIFGFGQDEAGEAYVLTASAAGQGVFRLVADPE
jgi:glucose/arabinose dehydrogenase